MKPIIVQVNRLLSAGNIAEAKKLCIIGIERYESSSSLKALFTSLLHECENLESELKPPADDKYAGLSQENTNVNKSERNNTLIILGNGPSLAEFIYDQRRREVLAENDTFGFNAAYREFERLNFWPTYYACFDTVVLKSHLKQFKRIINNVKRMFLIDTDYDGRPIVDFESERVQRIRLSGGNSAHVPGKISRDFQYWKNWQNTACNAAQVGLLLGYGKIILLGVDSQYDESIENITIENTREIPWDHYVVTEKINNNKNYWFGDYQVVGDRFNIPQASKYQTPAWDYLGKSEYGDKLVNCSSLSRINNIRRESFELEMDIEIEYDFNVPNLRRLHISNTEWGRFAGLPVLHGRYIYVICNENGAIGRKLCLCQQWIKYVNLNASPVLYVSEFDLENLPFLGYAQGTHLETIPLVGNIDYQYGSEISFQYHDNNHLIHCRAINVDIAFFVGRIIEFNGFYFLVSESDGKQALHFYHPQCWNSLTKDISIPLIIYSTNIDFNGVPLLGTADKLPEKQALQRGLSFIIRAKNEERNAYFVLGSLRPILNSYTYNCEVIFVDNNSIDHTYEEVARICTEQDIRNVFLFKYCVDVSKSGDEHSHLMERGEMNRSLDNYYNWCLEKAHKFNIVKWDADFLAITDNLIELLEKYDLANNEKKIAIWFSGKTLFKHQNEFLINKDTLYNEFRIFSKLHDYKWVYAPRWEICCQHYMEDCEKNIFSKCVFLELKDLGVNEFENRTNGSFINTCARDDKDAKIMRIISDSKVDDPDAYEQIGIVKGSIVGVDINPLLPLNFNTTKFNSEECSLGELKIMQSYWLNDYSKPTDKTYFKNPDNIVIQGLWIGKEISDIHRICIESFIKNGHCFVLYLYEEVANLPNGVVVMDANNILNRSLIYKFNDSYAGFSDIFRYKLLYQRGGWYVDLDIFCFKRFDFSEKIILSLDRYPEGGERIFNDHGIQVIPIREKYYVQTNPIKVYSLHPVIEEMYRICFRKIFPLKVFHDVFSGDVDRWVPLDEIKNYIDSARSLDDFNLYVCDLSRLPEDATFQHIIDLSDMSIDDMGQKTWNEIGPRLITEKVVEFELQNHLYDPICLQGFIPYYEVEKYVDPTFDFMALIEKYNVYSFDLFYTMWKARGILQKKDLYEGTLYKYLLSLVRDKSFVDNDKAMVSTRIEQAPTRMAESFDVEMLPMGTTDEDSDLLGQRSTKMCMQPFALLNYEPNGNLRLCSASSTHGYSVETNMGSCRELGTAQVWRGDKFRHIRTTLLTGKNLEPYCASCEYKHWGETWMLQLHVALYAYAAGVCDLETIALIRRWMSRYEEYVQLAPTVRFDVQKLPNLSHLNEDESIFNASIPESLIDAGDLPVEIDFNTLNRCNMSCIMCPRAVRFDDKGDKRPKYYRLGVDEFSDVCAGMKVKLAHFVGAYAEPLLNKEIFDLVRLAHKQGAYTAITTNGHLLTPQFVTRLIDAGLDMISISLHGATKSTAELIMRKSNFERVISNIRELQRIKIERKTVKPHIYFNFVSQLANVNEIPDFINMAADLGVRHVQIFHLIDGSLDDKSMNLVNHPELLGPSIVEAKRRAMALGVNIYISAAYAEIIANYEAGLLCH